MGKQLNLDVEQLKQRVQGLLNEESERLGFGLPIHEHYLHEDEWLYFVVLPDRDDARLYEYANALSNVEMKLREEGIENVLLVPSLPE
jgi:hypothetical protein